MIFLVTFERIARMTVYRGEGTLNRLLILVISFIGTHFAVADKPMDLKSSSKQQHLVELYSSEGCSSCPPAEDFINSLRQDPGLWKYFVPIQFHVTYWDDLGWIDPYAKPQFTQRQKDYVTLWQGGSLYTPGLVDNGNEWGHWQTERLKRIENYGPEVGVLEVIEVSSKTFKILFRPSIRNTENKYVLNAALLGRNRTSSVTRGENSGRNLKHDFLAVSLKKRDFKNDGSLAISKISFSDYDFKKTETYSAVFWVTDRNQKPIQAVGGDLSR